MIRELGKAGLTALPIQKLIDLRIHGTDEILTRRAD